MRALHQVMVNAAHARSGSPVFVGTQIPVRALLEHLDAGRDIESFLSANPGLDPVTVQQALALGLEALIRDVPPEPGPTQRSLLPRFDAAGVILNAEDLVVDQVVRKRVRCPACRMLVFRSWPEGWDAHAGSRCRGLKGESADDRKTEFKRRFGHLFRP